MNKSKRLIFFGNERLSSGYTPDGAPTLQALIQNGYNICAIVAHHEQGRSRNARELEIETVAKQYNIPLLLPSKPREAYDQLINLQADAGILVAYGRIIPQDIIDIFPHGILNIHPSLLPKYRGSTPIEQAILDGATETGVSIMQLVREMDAGPVYGQHKVTLNGTETKQELTNTLLTKGAQILIEKLPSILDGSLKPTPQDEAQATLTSLISKSDGTIDLSKSADRLEREIRAYAGWPKSRATIFERQVIITKARIAQDANDGALLLTCNPGWLEILELIAPSGKKMSGPDFLRGYRK